MLLGKPADTALETLGMRDEMKEHSLALHATPISKIHAQQAWRPTSLSIKSAVRVAAGLAFALAAFGVVRLFLTHPGLAR